MAFSPVTYAICKSFVKKSIAGLGALKGAPCQVKSIEDILDSEGKVSIQKKITLRWVATNPPDPEVWTEQSFLLLDEGRGIKNIVYNATKSTADYFWYDVFYYDGSQDGFKIPASATQMKKIVLTREQWETQYKPHPETSDKNAIYLVPTLKSGVYEQYIVVLNESTRAYEWLLLGTTEIDLDGYQKKIDSLITEAYKNYDPATSALNPTAHNVVGAINTFQKVLGSVYSDSEGKISNLTTHTKTDVVSVLNEIGDITLLEVWDPTTQPYSTFVEAINYGYQKKIDSDIKRTDYINYDNDTKATQPYAANVVGAINEFQDMIGTNNKYDYVNNKISGLNTYHNTNIVSALNDMGSLSDLEIWDPTAKTPTTLVEAINYMFSVYSLDKDTVVDKTKFIHTYKLNIDDKSGSPIYQVGDTVEVPRVQLELGSLDSEGKDFRVYDLKVGDSLYDTEDTSQKLYGKIELPSYKLQKMGQIEPTPQVESIVIPASSWTEEITRRRYSTIVSVSKLPVVINSITLDPTISGATITGTIVYSSEGSSTKNIQIVAEGTSISKPTKNITATINYGTSTLAAQYYLSIEGGAYDKQKCGVTIDIEKDEFIKDISLREVTTPDVPYIGAKVGDKYLDFEFYLADGSIKHVYVPCKDLFDPYEGKDAIKITYDSAGKVNIVKLVIYDPDNIQALTQDANGLRVYKATTDQYGFVKFAKDAEVLSADSNLLVVKPYDLYNFANNSTSVKGDLKYLYKDSNGEFLNNTIIKAINEVASIRLEELATPDSEDIRTYQLESIPDLGITNVLGDKIHLSKYILQVSSLSGVSDPKTYIIYYLTQEERLPGGTKYDKGLYMWVNNQWEEVSASEIYEVSEDSTQTTSTKTYSSITEAISDKKYVYFIDYDRKKYYFLSEIKTDGLYFTNWDEDTETVLIIQSDDSITRKVIDVVHPDEVTIIFNSEGKLATNIDYKTLILGSDGKIRTRVSGWLEEGGETEGTVIVPNIKFSRSSTADTVLQATDSSATKLPTVGTKYKLTIDGVEIADDFVFYQPTTGGYAATSSGYRIECSADSVGLKSWAITRSSAFPSTEYTVRIAEVVTTTDKIHYIDNTYVNIDNDTVVLNSEGQLSVAFRELKANKPIVIDSENKINLLYDDETIVLDSEDRISVPIDYKTLIIDSEDYIRTRIGGWLEEGSEVEGTMLIDPSKISASRGSTTTMNVFDTGALTKEPDATKKYKLEVQGQTFEDITFTQSGSFWSGTGTGLSIYLNKYGSTLNWSFSFINPVLDPALTTFPIKLVEYSKTDDVIHYVDNTYILVDNKTIVVNSEGALASVPESIKNGKATEIRYDSEYLVIDVLTDSETILVNVDNKLEVIRDEETIKLGSDGLYVPIDNDTVYISSEGLIKADTIALKGGVASEVVDDSEAKRTKVINVLHDDKTVLVDSENKLYVPIDKETIIIDSESELAVNIDDITITFNSENKLAVPIDYVTIIINSDGKLSSVPEPLKDGKATEIKYDGRYEIVDVLVDSETIIIDSENKLQANIDYKTLIIGSDGTIRTRVDGWLEEKSGTEGTVYLDKSITGWEYYSNYTFYKVNIAASYLDTSKTYKCSIHHVVGGVDTVIKYTESMAFVRIDEPSDIRIEGSCPEGFELREYIPISTGKATWYADLKDISVVYGDTYYVELCEFTPGENIIHYIDNTYVNIDNDTIVLNSEGQLSAVSIPLVDGKATEIIHNSSSEVVNVLVDSETIIIDSENKLQANIDYKTLIIGSDGTIRTRVGGWLEEGSETEGTIIIQSSSDVNFTKQTDYQVSAWDSGGKTSTPDLTKKYKLEIQNHTYKDITFTQSGSTYTGTGDGVTVTIKDSSYLIGKDIIIDTTEALFSGTVTYITCKLCEYEKVEGAVHYIDNTYINIDSETIIIDSQGRLATAFKALEANEPIKIDSENKINLLYDDETIVLDSENQISVPIDEKTLIIDSDGFIRTRVGGWLEKGSGVEGEIIVPGVNFASDMGTQLEFFDSGATAVTKVPTLGKKYKLILDGTTISDDFEFSCSGNVYTSIASGYRIICNNSALRNYWYIQRTASFTSSVYKATIVEVTASTDTIHYIDNTYVNIDDDTIILDSQGRLATAFKALEANKPIEIDSENKINLLYDDKTIVLDSEDQISVPIDYKTLIIDSEGYIRTRVGGWLEEGQSTTGDTIIDSSSPFSIYPASIPALYSAQTITASSPTLDTNKTYKCEFHEVVSGVDTILDSSDSLKFTFNSSSNAYLSTLGQYNISCRYGSGVANWYVNASSGSFSSSNTYYLKVVEVVDGETIHFIDNKYVNIDNDTIILDSQGRLAGTPQTLIDSETIIENSEGEIKTALGGFVKSTEAINKVIIPASQTCIIDSQGESAYFTIDSTAFVNEDKFESTLSIDYVIEERATGNIQTQSSTATLNFVRTSNNQWIPSSSRGVCIQDGKLYIWLTDTEYALISLTLNQDVVQTGTKLNISYANSQLLDVDNKTVIVNVDNKLCVPIMVGATTYKDGISGLVPTPTTDDTQLFLRGDGTWADPYEKRVILTDIGTHKFYEVIVSNGVLGIKETTSAQTGKITLTDEVTGVNYKLIINNTRLGIEEV